MEGGFEGLGIYKLRIYIDAHRVMQRFKQIGRSYISSIHNEFGNIVLGSTVLIVI